MHEKIDVSLYFPSTFAIPYRVDLNGDGFGTQLPDSVANASFQERLAIPVHGQFHGLRKSGVSTE